MQDRIRELQQAQGWTDSTLLALVWDILADTDRLDAVVARLEEIALQENTPG